jgi:hypothetical protein
MRTEMKLVRLMLCVVLAAAGCNDDDQPLDSAVEDAGVDYYVWLDAAIVEDTGRDQVPPDQALPDTALTDTALPDTALPDTALPDTLPPDVLLPDVLLPDAPPPDVAMPDQAIVDQAIVDQTNVDQTVVDLSTTDLSTADKSTADLASGDALTTATIKGVVQTNSTITCSTIANDNCKGVLSVVAFNTTSPQSTTQPVAQFAVAVADLSGGKSQAYELKGIPAGQTVHLAGILTEAGNPPSPPWPKTSDLTTTQLIAVSAIGGAVHTVNITLDVRAP